jgi:hypothetical protein
VGNAKRLTPLGARAALVLDHPEVPEAHAAWTEVVENSPDLERIVDAVRIRQGMDEEAAAGLPWRCSSSSAGSEAQFWVHQPRERDKGNSSQSRPVLRIAELHAADGLRCSTRPARRKSFSPLQTP